MDINGEIAGFISMYQHYEISLTNLAIAGINAVRN